MEIRQLIYFSAVFRQGSMVRAAEELLISQPALTRQISQLERELGTSLFDRVPTGMKPTTAGMALYRHALAILDLVGSAGEVVALAAPAVETVVVGLAPGLPEDWVARLLLSVKNEVPLARINFTDSDSTSQLRLLREGRLDIALIHQTPPEGLRIAKVRQEEFGVALRPGRTFDGEEWPMKQLDRLRVLIHARNQLPIGHDQLVAAAHEAGASPYWQFASYVEHAAACADASDAEVAVMTSSSAARLLPDWRWIPLVQPSIALETWCVSQASTRAIITKVHEVLRRTQG